MALEPRYAAARADAAVAEAVANDEIKKASAVELKRLMRLSATERFAALENPDLKLTRGDRRELVRSLRDKSPAKVTIGGGTASLWAIWRSRARYKYGSLAMVGLGLVCVIGLIAVARSRTPQQWVVLNSDQEVGATWSFSDGSFAGDRLAPGQKYALYGYSGDQALLRKWVPEVGYAQTRVNTTWLLGSR